MKNLSLAVLPLITSLACAGQRSHMPTTTPRQVTVLSDCQHANLDVQGFNAVCVMAREQMATALRDTCDEDITALDQINAQIFQQTGQCRALMDANPMDRCVDETFRLERIMTQTEAHLSPMCHNYRNCQRDLARQIFIRDETCSTR